MNNAASKNRVLLIALLLVVVGAIVVWQKRPGEESVQPVQPAQPEKPVKTPDAAGNLFGEAAQPAEQEEESGALPPGVNPAFYDSTEIQQGWMNRAATVINNNLPAGVTHAETRETFFNRGFKGWAVTCGEVKLYSGDAVQADFQRFVFPGVQTIYYENDIPNFDIYWDKVCVQTSDQYLPDELRGAPAPDLAG